MYLYPSLVTALTLLLHQVLTINVGRARAKYKIMPPAMSGDENFERVVRVQQNTLEQLVFFLPALWLFSVYVNPFWGGRTRRSLAGRTNYLCLGLLSSG